MPHRGLQAGKVVDRTKDIHAPANHPALRISRPVHDMHGGDWLHAPPAVCTFLRTSWQP